MVNDDNGILNIMITKHSILNSTETLVGKSQMYSFAGDVQQLRCEPCFIFV